MSLTPEELTFTGLSLVFLLLGIVLIASIVFSAFNPYDQIAISNSRKLAAIMSQQCVSGGSSPITFSFSLPQNVPVASNLLTVLPMWLMRNFGDPNYVLYYESYPPGDAIGWETYHFFQNRLYIILPDTNPKSTDGSWGINDVQQYVQQQKAAFSKQFPDRTVDASVVSNIILNDQYNGMDLYTQDSSSLLSNQVGSDKTVAAGSNVGGNQANVFFGFGSWDSAHGSSGSLADFTQEDYFRFQNYGGLPTVEKTLIKYESCGPDSLCLKTRSGVYRFPVSACDNKIKTVQFIYDVRQRASVTGTAALFFAAGGGSILWSAVKTVASRSIFAAAALTLTTLFEAAKPLATAFMGVKTADFSIASPCSLNNVVATYDKCDNANIPFDTDLLPCSGYIKYSLFSINSQTQ